MDRRLLEHVILLASGAQESVPGGSVWSRRSRACPAPWLRQHLARGVHEGAERGGHLGAVREIPIQKLGEAYARLARGEVRYRFVIDMASLPRG